jgi:two-component system, sensor histidine kinase LadS
VILDTFLTIIARCVREKPEAGVVLVAFGGNFPLMVWLQLLRSVQTFSNVLRSAHWVGAFVALLLSFGALAQTSVDLNRVQGSLQSVNRGGTPWAIEALQTLQADSTPQEAKAATGYEPFRPKAIYELDRGKALWLKFRVKLDQPLQKNWFLSSPKTFLDRLELHYQDEQGQWQMQQAGDNIAHVDWSVQSLAPHFKLPLFAAGEQEVFIKLVQNFPQQIPLVLQDERTAQLEQQNDLLLAGMVVGLLGLILALALHLAINYRDRVYAWYALYVSLSMLSISAYLGLSSYLLWPQAQWWPEYSVLVLIMASVVAQLWFCQSMFLRDSQSPLLKKTAKAIAMLGAISLPIMLLTPGATARIVIFSLGMVACFSMMGVIVFQALIKRMTAAYLWLLAYGPLTVSVGLALADNLSFVDPLGLPYSLPAYTLTFEAVTLLFSLHLHAKNRHALQERERAMASIDPLTGFLSGRVFGKRLDEVWKKSVDQSQDIALALIYVNHRSDQSDSESALRLEQKLLRSVRLLRTITRDVDLIGRIGGNVLAVAMPGIPMSDDLNNRFARLVALGMMTDRYDTQPTELRFRIAIGTRGTWGNDLHSLDNNLRGTIMQSGGWSNKPIRYITPPTAQSSLSALTANEPTSRPSGSGRKSDPPALNSSRSSRSSGGISSANHSQPSSIN